MLVNCLLLIINHLKMVSIYYRMQVSWKQFSRHPKVPRARPENPASRTSCSRNFLPTLFIYRCCCPTL